MKRLPFPSFRSGISVHETYFDVFMNALIINMSYTDIGRHINKLINVS